MAKNIVQILRKTSIYADYRLVSLLILGFVSGLPFLLTLSTLSRWLAEEGVSNTTIGLFMFATTPYSLKWLWAPAVDHWRIPFIGKAFGRQKSWLIFSQISLIISILMLAKCSPNTNLISMGIWTFLVVLFAATQDIVIDSYRIAILQESLSGAGAAIESIGFKLGMLCSGAGALYLAHAFGWQAAYQMMAFCILLGMVTVLLMPENNQDEDNDVQVKKVIDFWHPNITMLKSSHIFSVLLFIFFFKFGDVVLQAMSAPFLYDLGVSKLEFATVTKVFGIGLMVAGGLAAGVFINHFGVANLLIWASVLQLSSCLMFAVQAYVGYQKLLLIFTVGLEGFCSGVVAAFFISYLSAICGRRYSASNFTLLYSFGSLSRVLISAFSGWLADQLSWSMLFFLCAWTSLPVFFIAGKLRRKLTEVRDF